MPRCCDGCGGEFSIEHALDCRFGVLIVRHCHEVRDAIGDLASLVWGNFMCEPVVCKQSGSCALVADLCIRGVWVSQAGMLLTFI